jgi:hypothetical protein
MATNETRTGRLRAESTNDGEQQEVAAVLAPIAVAVLKWEHRCRGPEGDLPGKFTDHPSYCMIEVESSLLLSTMLTAQALSARWYDRGQTQLGESWQYVTTAIEDDLVARLAGLDPDNPF